MEQINEAYEFIKNVFRTDADAILRKVYVLPKSMEAAPPAPIPPSSKTKSDKKSTSWIAHPCPRNIIKIEKS